MHETIIRHADAPRFAHPGTEIVGYASPTRGGAALSAWRVRLDPGAHSPVHRLTRGEVFLMLEGTARFEIDDRVHEVVAGDAICVPALVALRLENASSQPFEAICCMPAGGMAWIDEGAPMTPPWAQ